MAITLLCIGVALRLPYNTLHFLLPLQIVLVDGGRDNRLNKLLVMAHSKIGQNRLNNESEVKQVGPVWGAWV